MTTIVRYYAMGGVWTRPGAPSIAQGGGTNTAPSAPQSLSETHTASSATLTFAAPANLGGSAITGYYAELLLNGSVIQSFPNLQTYSCTFTSLSASTGYVLSVKATNAIGTGPAATLAVTTSAAAGGSVGAGQAQNMWHNGWNGPNLSSYPSDVYAATTMLSWGMGQAASSGTGNITNPPWADGQGNGYSSEAAAKADVLSWVNAGKKVIYGIGGSGDGGIAITNSTQVAQARASINSIIASGWAFNGIDLDIESDGWNTASYVSLVAGLKADRPGFHINLCMGLWGTFYDRYEDLVNNMSANIDSYSIMLYDFPEAHDSQITGITVDKMDWCASVGIPASKVYMLYFPEPPEGYYNSTPTPSLATNAMVACRNAYPSIKGSGWWEDRNTSARSTPWDFPRAMKTAMT